jgi:HlyD family secretion protein
MRGFLAPAYALAGLLASGCEGRDSGRIQGYVDAELLYIASPLGGALVSLEVRRGGSVVAGDPLFALDPNPEQANRDAAARRLAHAQAELEDARKGARPTEIAAIEAKLAQARAALAFSESESRRVESALRGNAVAEQDAERARSARDVDAQRVAELEAELATAGLGARADLVAAAEAAVEERRAALAKADWDLAQKRRMAPEAAFVFDTLYREGEWVAAGKPVVVLLAPRLVKVRAFVPEERLAAVRFGMDARVLVDGVERPVLGKVTYVSPKAEYTPPVIFSRESRTKLVFMIEIGFEPERAAELHPGQPVDVELGSGP